MKTVKFTRMSEGDRDDYIFLEKHERQSATAVGDRLLAALTELDEATSAYRVSRYEHSLQAGTRAWWDGADIDWVVAALLHDVGDLYAPYNHDEYAAAILRPYLREQCTWVVANHGLFQRYYYAHHFGGDRDVRKRHESSPYYEDAVVFCDRWDQASFDPDFESLPLDHFRSLVEEIFSREPYQQQVIAAGVRRPLADPVTAAKRKG
ncbi:HD domain-containing protein [Acuticoccus mangrovi]|uniref:HD domain-containing protein n=1 Tax=Acuticoccus mangrovi TaxID=2796142 RepID=A0A934IRA4_9HYPH|nr:HD domain-containing protein [Acuticoccus mangrovi]